MAAGSTIEGAISSIEVVDLEGSKCSNFVSFDQGLYGGTGQAWDSKTVVLCGGSVMSKKSSYQCNQITQNGIAHFADMTKPRVFAASTLLHKGPMRMWILGGVDNDSSVGGNTTEIILSNKTVVPGPPLPLNLQKHSITQLSEDKFLLAGGLTKSGKTLENLKDTYIFTYTRNMADSSWSKGPLMSRCRYDHSASIIKDKITGKSYVVVIGGLPVPYSAHSIEYISVEDLITQPYQSLYWEYGPNIPFGEISGHSTLSWGDDILVIGGERHEETTDDDFLRLIYRLSLSNSVFKWTKVDQELKIGRRAFVALKIPASMATCN